jgi:hypothetical protein
MGMLKTGGSWSHNSNVAQQDASEGLLQLLLAETETLVSLGRRKPLSSLASTA